MTANINTKGAVWIAAEDAAARAEREAGWYWAWGEPPTNEVPRAFEWRFTLAAPLRGWWLRRRVCLACG